jgi:Ser-tRNA(Ala) deacylase AlaX
MEQNNDINEAKKTYHEPMHTAEHILNQTMIRMFGTGRSIMNHIEKKKSKCDYHFDRALTDTEVKKLECEVNRIIAMNLEVKEQFVNKAEAEEHFNLSKLPKEATGQLRIISIGEYDHFPCIGAHVANTSEIGVFEIFSTDYDTETSRLRLRYKLK